MVALFWMNWMKLGCPTLLAVDRFHCETASTKQACETEEDEQETLASTQCHWLSQMFLTPVAMPVVFETSTS